MQLEPQRLLPATLDQYSNQMLLVDFFPPTAGRGMLIYIRAHLLLILCDFRMAPSWLLWPLLRDVTLFIILNNVSVCVVELVTGQKKSFKIEHQLKNQKDDFIQPRRFILTCRLEVKYINIL